MMWRQGFRRAVLSATIAAVCSLLSAPLASAQDLDTRLAIATPSPMALPADLGAESWAADLPVIHAPTTVDLPYRWIIDAARTAGDSISLGNTSYGHLQNARELAFETSAFYVLPPHRSRGTGYGTEELIALIHEASHAISNRFEGSRLAVGNLSTIEGGDIYWSRSHNSGRDADFAFFVEDEDGNDVVVDDLITMRSNGHARFRREWRFDVERNWAFIESLLTSRVARVQWVFVYAPLKRMLLEYAEESGVDEELIERASRIMHQPGDSAPHNDHFHVRVYCSFDDRLEGCVDWGPRWDHVEFNDDALDRRVRELLRGLMDPSGETVQACIDFLEAIHPRPSARTIAAAIPHQSEESQLVLLDLLLSLGQHGVSAPLLPIAESGDSQVVRERIFDVVGQLGDHSAVAGLLGIIERSRERSDATLAVAAADALRHMRVDDSIERVVALVGHEDQRVREALNRTLARTTGFRPDASVASMSGDELKTWWTQWNSEFADWSRIERLQLAFDRAGYEVGDLEAEPALPTLLEAIESGPEHLAYIADRLLNEHTRHWTPLDGMTAEQRVEYWSEKVASR